ncbi:hypothetical protein JL720_6896 [Aureococcus anophagefferens]|nr:hypothetical protein JL720_6896 [Aureococcus anophagefferens]
MKGMRLRPASAPFASSPANQAEDKLPRTVGWLMPIDPASPSSRPRTAPSAQTPSRLPFGGSPSGGASAPLDRTLARWIKSYNSEQTVFASDFLSAEVKLREAATTTETLRLGGEYVPPRNLAIVTCDVLLSIAKQFGRFEGLMNLVARNVMRCVFPPRTDPSALADGASGDGAVDEPPAKGTDLVYMVPWYEMWRTAVQEQRRLGHVVHERDEGVAMREAVQKKTKLVAQLLDSNVHFRLKEKREELNEAYDALLETNRELEAQREVLGQELTLEKEKVEKAAKSSRKKHVDKVVGRARVSFANRWPRRRRQLRGADRAEEDLGPQPESRRRPRRRAAAAVHRPGDGDPPVHGRGRRRRGRRRIAALATPFAADFDYKDNPAFNWAKKNKLRNTREVGSSTLQALRLRNACDSRFLQASRDAQTELPGGGPLAAWERRGDERKGRRERDRRRDAAAKKFGGSITAKHRPFGSGHSGPAARRTHQIKDRAELDVDQCLELASDALVEKVRQDAEDRVLHQPFQHLRPYFMDYLLRRYGVRALATKFRRAVEKCEEEAGEAFAASTADLRGSAASPPRGSSPAKADGAGEAKKPKPKKRKNKDRGGGRRSFNQNVDDREGVVQFFTELILSCVGTSEDFKELLDDAFEEPPSASRTLAGIRVAFRSLRAKAPRAYYDEILRDAVLGHGDTARRCPPADALIHADEYSPRGVFSYAEFEELVQDHCKLADVDRQDATFLFKRWHELCDIRGTAARLPRDERTEEAFLNDIRDPTAARGARGDAPHRVAGLRGHALDGALRLGADLAPEKDGDADSFASTVSRANRSPSPPRPSRAGRLK